MACQDCGTVGELKEIPGCTDYHLYKAQCCFKNICNDYCQYICKCGVLNKIVDVTPFAHNGCRVRKRRRP